MELDEILNNMRSWEAPEDAPGYADQIAQIVGDMRSGADASLAEVNAALEQKDADIQRLQAENYKLMTALGQNVQSGDPDPGDPAPEAEPDPNGPVEDITDYIKED